ncbi:hypothetical protein B0T19DRAFT_408950, partial [Cercophora scortea]
MMLGWDGQGTEFSALLNGVQQHTIFLLSWTTLFFCSWLLLFSRYFAALFIICLSIFLVPGWLVVVGFLIRFGDRPNSTTHTPHSHRRAIPWSREKSTYLLDTFFFFFWTCCTLPICCGHKIFARVLLIAQALYTVC